ncbi:MAG TPA: hypothetical protein VG370_05315 [Chloroflexota bacterium]|nr:hypothetical protein [Chloroflexota bacterium]
MDAPEETRWAGFCPRCGARNPAAADTCRRCGLAHASPEPAGADVVHGCGAAGPAWAVYCIGCGERLVASAAPASETDGPSLAPRTQEGDAAADPPRPRGRPRHILPARAGPAEGISLSRHVLLERSSTRRTRSESFRLLAAVLIVVLTVGLIVRALAMPGQDVLALVRAHPVPGRGAALAVAAIDGLHRLLAGTPTATPTARP